MKISGQLTGQIFISGNITLQLKPDTNPTPTPLAEEKSCLNMTISHLCECITQSHYTNNVLKFYQTILKLENAYK